MHNWVLIISISEKNASLIKQNSFANLYNASLVLWKIIKIDYNT